MKQKFTGSSKQAEEELYESKERLSLIFDNVSDSAVHISNKF